MVLLQLFCDADDFCQHDLPIGRNRLTQKGVKKRNRHKCLSTSEIITLVVYYQMSGFKNFKTYYLNALLTLRKEFPGLPSYNRFVELMAAVLEPIALFMESRCATSDGIAFVDSTSLCVCENIRIPRHKTFAAEAGRGKSSTGWFYGFKLHFTVNDCGDMLSFCITPANVDDRKPVPFLAQKLLGKLFGDKGYISKKLAALLAEQDVELITTLKKNMKAAVRTAFDRLILRKRSIIETINDQLKNVFDLEHSRHRSLVNFLVHTVACLIAYSYQEKKPSLNLRHCNLLPLLA